LGELGSEHRVGFIIVDGFFLFWVIFQPGDLTASMDGNPSKDLALEAPFIKRFAGVVR
jgi:hypothetical protein